MGREEMGRWEEMATMAIMAAITMIHDPASPQGTVYEFAWPLALSPQQWGQHLSLESYNDIVIFFLALYFGTVIQL